MTGTKCSSWRGVCLKVQRAGTNARCPSERGVCLFESQREKDRRKAKTTSLGVHGRELSAF